MEAETNEVGRARTPSCDCGANEWDAMPDDPAGTKCIVCGATYTLRDYDEGETQVFARVRTDQESEPLIIARFGAPTIGFS